MTEYDYYLTAVKEDGVSLFDVPYVYQTNELIMIALETSEKPKGQGTGTWTIHIQLSNGTYSKNAFR